MKKLFLLSLFIGLFFVSTTNAQAAVCSPPNDCSRFNDYGSANGTCSITRDPSTGCITNMIAQCPSGYIEIEEWESGALLQVCEWCFPPNAGDVLYGDSALCIPAPTPTPSLSCPTITNTTCRADGGINIYWSAVSGANRYKVIRDGINKGEVYTTSFADILAPCGISHIYNVYPSANSGSTYTTCSQNVSKTCPCAPTATPIPTSTPTNTPTPLPTNTPTSTPTPTNTPTPTATPTPTPTPTPIPTDPWHDYNPTETFIYRPDFLINTPEEMKDFIFEWRELAPEKL